MADVTLKIDADTAAYIAKLSKLAEEHGKVNQHLGKHGDLTDKFSHGLDRALSKSIAIVEAMRAITEAIAEAASRAEEMSKKTGASETKLTGNLLALGFKGSQVAGARAVFQQQGGLASQDEMYALAGQFVEVNKKRAAALGPGNDLTPRQIYELTNAARQGGSLTFDENFKDLTSVYTDADKGYGRGREARDVANDLAAKRYGLVAGTPDAIGAGIATLDGEMLDELSTQGYEKENEARRRELLRGKGRRARLVSSYLGRAQDEVNPLVNAGRSVVKYGSLGTTEVILSNIVESQQQANLINQRNILREDAQGEGKK